MIPKISQKCTWIHFYRNMHVHKGIHVIEAPCLQKHCENLKREDRLGEFLYLHIGHLLYIR